MNMINKRTLSASQLFQSLLIVLAGIWSVIFVYPAKAETDIPQIYFQENFQNYNEKIPGISEAKRDFSL